MRNLVALINEVYLFFSKRPKRQRFLEVAIKIYLPESTHLKLHGLCKTRWVEQHTCSEVFYELYETFISYLDTMISPHQYPELSPVGSDHSRNWDRDTKLRAQGLKASLSSFQTIAVFFITKNALDEVKSIASKLQKREQDFFDRWLLNNIERTRSNIDTVFTSWYDQILTLAEQVGSTESVPRKTSFQRNRTNIPSTTPCNHYKRAIAIPLLDSLFSQMKERFSDDRCYALKLRHLVPLSYAAVQYLQ